MKKIILFCSFLFVLVFILSACSKSPVGPSMSSMSISANATSSSAATNGTTSNNNQGDTSVAGSQTGTVSAQGGDTGVAGVGASTGVSSEPGNLITENLDYYGTMTWTIYANSLPEFQDNYIDHNMRYVSRTPKIVWKTRGVNSAYQKVHISIGRLSNNENTWEIKNLDKSRGSVVFGDSSSGTVVTPAKTLLPGIYWISIVVYDNETDNNNNVGGGNFTVQ